MADATEDGTRQHNFAILNFTKKIALIGGTGYTGEIKKGIFLPKLYSSVFKNTLPMHCSANVGKNGRYGYFLRLVRNRKNDIYQQIQNRRLIGDDEHGWTT